MKFILCCLIVFTSVLASAYDTHVNGYYKKNGTYVQPHYRTHQDSTPDNNYSTIGNTNPYTGKAGTVDPYRGSYNPYSGTTSFGD